MKPLSYTEIRGNWATLLLSWNRDGTLDLPRVAAEVEVLIGYAVDGIYANGTAGEFHTLSEDEFDRVAGMLAERCTRAGMPFQIGASQMSAQISLARVRRTAALAPGAFQVILPDWFPVTDEEALAFLNGMAEAAGGIGLVLYNPPHAKRVLPPEAIGRLAKAVPGMVGVKVADGDEAWYAAMRRHVRGISVFVPGHHLATGFTNGAHGAYSNVACLHPGAAQRWWEQMKTDLPRALDLERRLRIFMERHIRPFIVEEGYCAGACDRLLARIGGWAQVGARMRWPYRSIPADAATQLRPVARHWLPEFFEPGPPNQH